MLKLITPAAGVVTLAEAKAHLEVDHSERDAMIDVLILAAGEAIEKLTGRSLMPQTWDLLRDTWPTDDNGALSLMKTPVESVEGIFYLDDTGLEQQIDADDYYLDNVTEPAWVLPVTGFDWPTTLESANAVRVRFVAGYTDRASIPNSLRVAVLMLVAHWFGTGREPTAGGTAAEVPFTVSALTGLHRIHWV